MSFRVKIFTLRFNLTLGEFDDTDVQRFLADKQLIEVRDHFFVHQGLPCLAMILLYNSAVETLKEQVLSEKSKQQERFDPKEVLSEDDWTLYTSLKEWRNELAKSEGIPPYIIATNRQIAEIANDRPDSLDGLKRIEGLGKAKVESYGAAILGFISKTGKQMKKDQKKTTEANDSTQLS